MKILIVDDSDVIRVRLVTLLEEIDNVEVVGEATTVMEAFVALRRLKPDAMTLDLRLPDGSGLEVLRWVQHEGLQTAAIVLTNYPYPQYEKRARAAGAYAFLNKAHGLSRIAELVETLMSERSQPTPPTMREDAASEAAPARELRHE